MLPLDAVSLSQAVSMQESQLRLKALSVFVAVNTKGFIFRGTVSDKHRQLEYQNTDRERVWSDIYASGSWFLTMSQSFGWLTIPGPKSRNKSAVLQEVILNISIAFTRFQQSLLTTLASSQRHIRQVWYLITLTCSCTVWHRTFI